MLTTLGDRYPCPPFTDEETKVQEDIKTYQGHRDEAAFESRHSGSKMCPLKCYAAFQYTAGILHSTVFKRFFYFLSLHS